MTSQHKTKLETVIYHLATNRRLHQVGILLYILSLVTLMVVAIDPTHFIQYGYLGVFAFNLIGPGTILIPILAPTSNLLVLVIVSALGMQLNDSVGWIIGRNGDVVFPPSVKRYRLLQWVGRSNVFVFYFLSIIPVPYDVVGLVSGYSGIPFAKFFIPSVLGKMTRFYILGSLVIYFNLNISQLLQQLIDQYLQ